MKTKNFLKEIEMEFEWDGWTVLRRRFGKITMSKGWSVISVKSPTRVKFDEWLTVGTIVAISALVTYLVWVK